MRKEVLLIALFICCSLSASHPELDPDQKIGSVTGKVIDRVLQKPILYVALVIKSEDGSETVTEGITRENGSFKIDRLPEGTFIVEVRRIGYKTHFQRISISKDKRKLDLGTIALDRAQDTVFTESFNGKLDSIHSEALNQKRYIQVFTPTGHTLGSTDKYDVLYVLDGGNWNTGLISRLQRFVEGEGNMPPTIIVSVMGIDRNRELTPTQLENWETSGGGEKFLHYITKELIPYIDGRYPSNGDNTLWGHSLSGMFAVYAMLNASASFKSYIAVDPSLWWDNSLIPKMAADKLPDLAGANTTLFISGREGKAFHEMKMDTLEKILKEMAPPQLTWKVNSYPNESHSSLRLKGTYDGLKFTYAGMTNSIEYHPMNGTVVKDKPVKIWYFNDPKRVHYTLDGSIPTRQSDKVVPEIALNGPAKITFKRFSNRSAYDITASGDFSPGEMLRPVSKPKDLNTGGFKYAYYEGDWDQWPDLDGLSPKKTGITDIDFNIADLPRKKNYALLIDGFLETKEEGYYIFIFQADKGSKLYLDGRPILKWDGNYHPMSYIVPLSAGYHPFRIEYLHKTEDHTLRYSYLTPSRLETKDPVAIPLKVQNHDRKTN